MPGVLARVSASLPARRHRHRQLQRRSRRHCRRERPRLCAGKPRRPRGRAAAQKPLPATQHP
eukprot:scaffold1178_cov282-Prasinococcus_capsulatus_cf.AAC.1